jgi:uridine kinase
MKAISPIVIGICGISGSGKTMLTKEFANKIPQSIPIYWDSFESISEFPSDYIAWYNTGKDYSAWKTPALAQILKHLKQGMAISCPATGKILEPQKIIIYDAPLGRNHTETGQYIDFLVFLDTPLDVALARRLLRDHLSLDPIDGQAIKQELDTYIHSSRPLFLETDSLKSSCDLVINGSLSIRESLKQIMHNITPHYSIQEVPL